VNWAVAEKSACNHRLNLLRLWRGISVGVSCVMRGRCWPVRDTRMKNHISGIERRILAALQEGLPTGRSPYNDMAQKVGITTRQLLVVLKNWKRQGKLRRIAAIVNYLKVGLQAGAMVVWQVEPERVGQVGRILAGFKEVSHVYERRIDKNWPYNVYSMVHAPNQKELQCTVERMAKASGVGDYRVLVTEKELKKVGPAYIQDS